MLDIIAIQNLLPHRYPFLLLDRVLEVEDGVKTVAIKNVTINEQFFIGHYPQQPLMPGVLIIEAMAQAGGVAMLSSVEDKDRLPLLAGVDQVRFRRQVVPGDQLRIEVEILKMRGETAKVTGKALVDGQLAAEATLLFVLAKRGKEISS
ncbi:MAG: 3-hydroxyacyl-ACP dehydratase FabZ [Firmicutes bacterium]|nr:3-hydroxyacyl-ACP dehydratase FabZ [Bacillota bacterium]